jgi:hypothetical protein
VIQTTDTELQALAKAEDSARDGTTHVKVPREALRNLLRDHYTLWTIVRERRIVQVTTKEDQRSLT